MLLRNQHSPAVRLFLASSFLWSWREKSLFLRKSLFRFVSVTRPSRGAYHCSDQNLQALCWRRARGLTRQKYLSLHGTTCASNEHSLRGSSQSSVGSFARGRSIAVRVWALHRGRGSWKRCRGRWRGQCCSFSFVVGSVTDCRYSRTFHPCRTTPPCRSTLSCSQSLGHRSSLIWGLLWPLMPNLLRIAGWAWIEFSPLFATFSN